MGNLKLACVVVMCMVVMMGRAKMVESVTCGEVTQELMACIGYLMGQNGSPSQGCCEGVRKIIGEATTTSDRQTVCNCLKADANSYPINYNNAEALPAKCNVNIPYKLSPTTNCADIRF
ncbi:hypothetical protein VNO77_20715 [Canavalia gladiata]|uniref:Non-specific lipid-transfer protein n=1 Tax=Canavalia gladiata TaxID=3824 RepID=A0AAN9QQU4_CANGL